MNHLPPRFARSALQSAVLLAFATTAAAQAAAASSASTAAGADAPTTLPAVRVKANVERETPTGPVTGYVARRASAATKTDTPLAESPQSVSVITRDQMDAQNVQSVSDAVRYTAGVMAEANGPDPRADVLTIRGFNAGMRSAFRDGLRDYAFNGQGGVVIESWGLERIEVLRGPASVLYGQGDAGGTVNLVSKRPTATPLGEAQLQLGSYGRKQGALDVGGPIDAGGEWRYRVNALVRQSDTQIDHVPDDRIYIAPALTWAPSAATQLTLLADYQKNKRGQGYQAWPRFGSLEPSNGLTIPENRFVGEPGFDRFDQERTSVGYQFEHRLDERWTLRQNTRHMRQETLANTIYQAGLLPDGRTVERFASAGRERVQNTVIDNQVQFKATTGGVEHTVLAGLDHQRMRGQSGAAYGQASDLDLYAPVYGQPFGLSADAPPVDTWHRLDQTGLYLQEQLKVPSLLAFTLGGRYDTTRTSTTPDEPQRDHATTWRTGLVYLGVPGLSPYVGYAESFSPTVGLDAQARAFKPETGRQFEAGVRYEPANSDASALLSVFDLRRRNVLTSDPNDPNFSIQRGEVRSRGVELEGKASLARGLDAVLALTWNDVKVTQSNGTDLGKTPSATPERMASLWLSWRLPPSLVPGLRLSAGARYTGPTFGDEEETIGVPGHTLFDAGLGLDFGALSSDWARWSLAVNVANLADKRYVATCGYYADGCKYGYRRNAAATLSYRW